MSLVSVVVTTYNQAGFVGAALQSVLAQTFRDFEVIVVDDGSTDDTSEVVRSFGSAVTTIRQRNKGVAASRNTGVAATRGELVAFLDGDDLWEPEKLASQVALATRWPASAVFVVDGVEFCDTEVVYDTLFRDTLRKRAEGADGELTISCYRALLAGNLIASTSQVLVRKAALNIVGPSNPSFRLGSDYDLYLRLAKRYDFTFLNKRLVRYRYLPTSASGPRLVRHLRWAQDDLAILTLVRDEGDPECRPAAQEALRQKTRSAAALAYQYGSQGNRRWAAAYLLRLWRTRPLSKDVGIFLLALLMPRTVVKAAKPIGSFLLTSRSAD